MHFDELMMQLQFLRVGGDNQVEKGKFKVREYSFKLS
jgi:hypothetical protein